MKWCLVLLAACADPSTATRTEVAIFPAQPVAALDLVFQIDNSGGTAHLQSSLGASLAPLMTALAGVSLHAGVVSSDLGTSGGATLGTVGQGGCAGFGDGGRFRATAIDPSAAGLDHMLRLGSTGCGFEQPLAATRAALHSNDGFFRADASLAVIILADEDDCSLVDPSLLTTDESVLGPLMSFRCTTQGVICDQRLDMLGEKTNCRPNRGSRYVEDPELTRQALAAFRSPDRATVSAIVGIPEVAIEERVINGMPQLALTRSCHWQLPLGSASADPPVRIASLVDSYASRGSLESACDVDYKPQVTRIATAIKRSLGTACIDMRPIERCIARDVDSSARNLPRCPATGDCFDIVSDPQACPETAGHARVIVDRKTTPSSTTRVELYCD